MALPAWPSVLSRFSRPPAPPPRGGELQQLQLQLRQPAPEQNAGLHRACVQRVVACMTAGLDTSPLMAEMVRAVDTQDLVQKKLVYVYLLAHAEADGEDAVLCMTTLQADCRADSPLVRGLALRSLSSLAFQGLQDQLGALIESGLADRSAYVRKTAVLAAGKLHRTCPRTFGAFDLLDALYERLGDPDALVCTNAVAVLDAVHGAAGDGGLLVNHRLAHGMLTRLGGLSPGQRCVALDLAAQYAPQTEAEMFDIMNLVEGHLHGSSSAVVLAAAKVLLKVTQNRPELHLQVYERVKGPLLDLMLTAPADVAFVCLCHIRLLAARQPQVFAGRYADFYPQCTDPHYIRELKLAVLETVASDRSAPDILHQLGQFVADFADASQGAIRSMGRIAVKAPAAAPVCVQYLNGFARMALPCVASEVCVACACLLREHGDTPALAELAAALACDGPRLGPADAEGRAAALWLLGRCAAHVDEAPYVVEDWARGFDAEPSAVKMELLSVALGLFFRRPPEMQPVLGPLLRRATADPSEADVYDRAALYYRLLQVSPPLAAAIANGAAPPAVAAAGDPALEVSDKIFDELNTLSVVYGMPADRFAPPRHSAVADALWDEDEGEELSDDEADGDCEGDALGDPRGEGEGVAAGAACGDVPATALGLVLEAEPTIDPAVFQRKWSSLPVVRTLTFPLALLPAVEQVEVALEAQNIMCLASGTHGASDRYYFYAQSVGRAGHLLAECVIDADGNLHGVVKGDDPGVGEFAAHIQTAFRTFQ